MVSVIENDKDGAGGSHCRYDDFGRSALHFLRSNKEYPLHKTDHIYLEEATPRNTKSTSHVKKPGQRRRGTEHL